MIDRLLGEGMADVWLNALGAGLAVVLMCGVLSVLVVVKRMAFIGQGISHSAFGGIGLAALLASLGWMGSGGGGGAGEYAVVVGFCVAAALGMAGVSEGRAGSGTTAGSTRVDTAIGAFLVASMALGAVLVQASRQIALEAGRLPDTRTWESILFGQLALVDRQDVLLGWCVAAPVVAAAWWFRRPLLFWAFDEESSRAFGVRGGAMKCLLIVLLALATVTAMRIAGVVLATALLVLPGATALHLSSRLRTVIALSCALGVAGLVGGIALSIWTDWALGPSIVLLLSTVFAAAFAWGRMKGGRREPRATLRP